MTLCSRSDYWWAKNKRAYRPDKTVNIDKSLFPELSRSALDRLLDASNPSVTLQTMDRAARALGKKLRIELMTSRTIVQPVKI